MRRACPFGGDVQSIPRRPQSMPRELGVGALVAGRYRVTAVIARTSTEEASFRAHDEQELREVRLVQLEGEASADVAVRSPPEDALDHGVWEGKRFIVYGV